MELKDKLLELVERRQFSSVDDLLEGLPGEDAGDVLRAANQLVREGKLAVTKKGKYALPGKLGLVEGQLEVKRGGFGFVRQEDGDIFIAEADRNGALDGERVLVRLRESSGGANREGEIVRILEAKPYVTVGTYRRSRGAAFVVSDDAAVDDIFIPKQENLGAKDGQKVVAEITKRMERGKSPEGKIVEILGFPEEKGVDVLSTARAFHLTPEFSKEVLKEAQELPEITEEELGKRENLFEKVIITIDGDDAKDLDDAVSLETAENGNEILGVHIADVSYYVREGSKLDQEALKRGTSVYLFDEVIPMLPKELSNGICSLNEREIRLTLSCFMEIDKSGAVVSHRLARTAIRSRHRMTYANVNRILERKDARLCAEYADIVPMLERMRDLAARLRAKRTAAGSIDFDIDEAKIELDEDGRPVQIGLRERGTGERLIEDFMLTANETVAEDFFFGELPFIYRIHEQPDGDKMKELAIFLGNFGYRLKGYQNIHAKALQQVLNQVAGKPEEAVVNRVTLRSLQKAKYSCDNEGHFGLASKAYCHFTSPIRRYPDLMVHRLVKEMLDGKIDKKRADEWESRLPEIAKQSSERERAAIDAERKMEDMKKAEYIGRFIGEEFDGIISGVMPTAIFVELPNTVEGIIPLREMKDDYYTYYRERYCVIGERTRQRYSLGDPIRVSVFGAEPSAGRVEFRLAGKAKKMKKRRRPPKAGKRMKRRRGSAGSKNIGHEQKGKA